MKGYVKRYGIAIARTCWILAILLSFFLSIIYAQQKHGHSFDEPPIFSKDDMSYKGIDNHAHHWDDLGAILVEVTSIEQITNKEDNSQSIQIYWRYKDPVESRVGSWVASHKLATDINGIPSGRIKKGELYIAFYCKHCSTVIWLYNM